MRVPQTIKRIVGGAVGVAALVALAIPGTANAAGSPITVNSSATANLVIKGTNAALRGHTFKAIRLAIYSNATAEAGKLDSVAISSKNAPNGVKAALNNAYTATGNTLPTEYIGNVMGAVASQWLGFPVTGIPNSDTTSNDETQAYSGALRNFATKLLAQPEIKTTLASYTSTVPAVHPERITSVPSSDTTSTTATFTGVGTGMYLVVDTTAASGGTVSNLVTPASIPMIVGTELIDNASNSYTEFAGDAVDITLGEVNVKNNTPTIKKELADPTQAGKASIGSEISYRISGSVPLTTGFDHYTYIVTDTPGAGLTFNPSSVVVDLGADETTTTVTHTMSSTTDYVVTPPANPGDPIVFNLSPGIRGLSPDYYGEVIRIHYTMTVNNNAVSGTSGNLSNGIVLRYSNDPSAQPDNDDGKPNTDPTNPATENEIDDSGTPVNVYFYGFTLEDVSKANPSDKLAYAKFNVLDPVTNQPIKFIKLGDGNYKRSMDPANDANVTDELVSSNSSAGGADAPKGQVKISGLGAATYKVNEIDAPPSYSDLFKSEFTVTISATDPANETYSNSGATWGLVTAGSWTHADAATHLITVKEVTSFTQLPMTGGAGAIVVGLAVVVLLGAAGAIYIYVRRSEKSLSQEG